MRRRDLRARGKRHRAPVPIANHVADAHPAAVADDEIRARAVMIPGWLDRIARRTAEHKLRALSVESKVGETFNCYLRIYCKVGLTYFAIVTVEAAVGSRRELDTRCADPLRLRKRGVYGDNIVVVRLGKAEIRCLDDDSAARPRRGNLNSTRSNRIGTCRTDTDILLKRQCRGRCGGKRRIEYCQDCQSCQYPFPIPISNSNLRLELSTTFTHCHLPSRMSRTCSFAPLAGIKRTRCVACP